ncbi:probable DNA double-strand break repair Rad50 ATPase [Polyodon spathula]|uniref:probable DNA double-strand break repair Rad50 ATPase n=1 Tax=Polyodon spathula TaxID=7913 RepID=UPI001B7E1425|nr:probable DNA double-strand break repair Rad50 ATPase [Polyodon spathula]
MALQGDGQTYRSEGSVMTKCSRCESLEEQLEDYRRRHSQLQQEMRRGEGEESVRALPQGSVKEKGAPAVRKDIRPDNSNHERQRQLVTEQLKSLFKEKQQLNRAYSKLPDTRKGERSLEDWIPKSRVIQNAADTIESQERRQQELEGENERLRGKPGYQEFLGMQKQVERLQEQLQAKDNKMSSMNNEMETLKEKNENLMKAKLRFQQQIQGIRTIGEGGVAPGVPHLSPGAQGSQDRSRDPSPSSQDGTFMARQVDIVDGDKLQTSADSWSTPVSSRSPTPLYLETPPQSSSTHSIPSPAARMLLSKKTPELSPLSSQNSAGSQESLPEKHQQLLSPRPYRSQAAANTFKFGER